MVYASRGIEFIHGGDGDDTIFASSEGLMPSSDGATVEGGQGDDRIYGELATPSSNAAAQSVEGGRARGSARPAPPPSSCPPPCFLGVGSDTFNGGAGDDVVYGERGNDQLFGGGGNDLLYGGIGDDTLNGNDGNDLLAGEFGADSIDGNSGRDLVRGDGTIDTLQDSGGGTDTLSFATAATPGFTRGLPAGYPSFPSSDGERGVYVDLSANLADNGGARYGGGTDTLSASGFENVIGSPFSDYIVGSSAANVIDGGGGGDVILGGSGKDTIYGGADGDHVDGGAASNTLIGGGGSDYCANPSTTNCERLPPSGPTGVIVRDASKISVGFLAPDDPGVSFTELYLSGSEGSDDVTVSYSQAGVTFVANAGEFDTTQATTSGCGTYTATTVVCSLGKGLDAIVAAGMGGADTLSASGFPISSSVVLLGGEGGDRLIGGDASEDVLADGPDTTGAGGDVLEALGRDDALLNNDGVDELFGGIGNDLFLSTTICDGDRLAGGADKDNASWAKLSGTGIEAGIAEAVAGRPGATGPACDGQGEATDTLDTIDDLEGTSAADGLYGGPGANQLLGRAGADTFYGRESTDLLITNSGDLDPIIVCDADADSAWIDNSGYGDQADASCETVTQKAPQNSG